ncbi:hypothetical protein EVJ58_g10652, partial [Rhodofomes roseus]
MRANVLLAFVLSAVSAAPVLALPVDVSDLSVRDAGLYVRELMPIVADRDMVKPPPVKGPGNGEPDHHKREDDHDHHPTHVVPRGPVKTPAKGPNGGPNQNPKREDDHNHHPTHVAARGPVKTPAQGPG